MPYQDGKKQKFVRGVLRSHKIYRCSWGTQSRKYSSSTFLLLDAPLAIFEGYRSNR